MVVTTPSLWAAKWDCQMAPSAWLNTPCCPIKSPHFKPHLPTGSSRYVGAGTHLAIIVLIAWPKIWVYHQKRLHRGSLVRVLDHCFLSSSFCAINYRLLLLCVWFISRTGNKNWPVSQHLVMPSNANQIKIEHNVFPAFGIKMPDGLPKINRGFLKRLACNRRDLSNSLLHPQYAEAHTQHYKKVDRHQNGKIKKNHIS